MTPTQRTIAAVLASLAAVATIGLAIAGILSGLGIVSGSRPIPKVERIRVSSGISTSPPEVTPAEEIDIIGQNLDLVSAVLLTRGIGVSVRVFHLEASGGSRLTVIIPPGVKPGDYNLEFKTMRREQPIATGWTLKVISSTVAATPTPVSEPTQSTGIPTLKPTPTQPPTPTASSTAVPPPTPTWIGWYFDASVGATADPRVRSAIDYAIDEAGIHRNLFYLPNWPSLEGAAQSYNLEQANRLLSEAGYPDGFAYLCISAVDGENVGTVSEMASLVAVTGIEVIVRQFPCTSGRIQITFLYQ